MNNLIIFAGIDGAGKTTTAKALKYCLDDSYLFTHEPYYENYKELIATISSPLEKAYIFTCDRIRHFENVVYPAIKEGKIVIMDRSHYCNIAYQSAEVTEHESFVMAKVIERIQPRIPPHTVIWFYCDPKVAFERKKEFNVETLTTIQKHYKQILSHPHVVDTTYDTPAETLEKVIEIIKSL